MIISANLLIKELKDGVLTGEDVSDGKIYLGNFSTDIDINKSIKKQRPKFFKNKKVDQEMLLKMLEISNNFNDRDKKVQDKIDLELSENKFLKEVKKSIEKLDDEKEYIYGEDEDEVKFRNKDIVDFIKTKAVDKENFNEVYKKLENLYEIEFNKIKDNINKSYDINVNSPIVFTGNLISDDKTILSKNAYVDFDGNLTGRNAFYSSGIRGNFFDDDLTIILRIEKVNNDYYKYIVPGNYLTKEKTFNIIKRNLTTLDKVKTNLLVYFIKKDKESKDNIEEIEKYNNLIRKFREESKDQKEKINEIFLKYKKDIIEILNKIKENIKENDEYSEKLNQLYDIQLPILNNFELEKNIKESIDKELNLFKNINKKFLDELVELRTKTSDNDVKKIKEDLELYIRKEYEKRIIEKGLYATYFRIAGRTDFNNDGYGFITEVPNASKKVKNFMGFFINIANLKQLKFEIFETLSKFKEKLEK
jgi:hypothetical protein